MLRTPRSPWIYALLSWPYSPPDVPRRNRPEGNPRRLPRRRRPPERLPPPPPRRRAGSSARMPSSTARRSKSTTPSSTPASHRICSTTTRRRSREPKRPIRRSSRSRSTPEAHQERFDHDGKHEHRPDGPGHARSAPRRSSTRTIAICRPIRRWISRSTSPASRPRRSPSRSRTSTAATATSTSATSSSSKTSGFALQKAGELAGLRFWRKALFLTARRPAMWDDPLTPTLSPSRGRGESRRTLDEVTDS